MFHSAFSSGIACSPALRHCRRFLLWYNLHPAGKLCDFSFVVVDSWLASGGREALSLVCVWQIGHKKKANKRIFRKIAWAISFNTETLAYFEMVFWRQIGLVTRVLETCALSFHALVSWGDMIKFIIHHFGIKGSPIAEVTGSIQYTWGIRN